MKVLSIVSNLCFFTGLALKFFHIHHNALLMLAGMAGVVISLVIGLIKKADKAALLVGVTNLAWLLGIFVSAKFLPVQKIVFAIAALLTIIVGFILFRSKKIATAWPVLIPITIALLFFFMPTHQLYYLLSIKWNYERDTDYITWDKYSWFLYQNGEYDHAMEVSANARRMATEQSDSEWAEMIDQHSAAIKDRAWVRYH